MKITTKVVQFVKMANSTKADVVRNEDSLYFHFERNGEEFFIETYISEKKGNIRPSSIVRIGGGDWRKGCFEYQCEKTLALVGAKEGLDKKLDKILNFDPTSSWTVNSDEAVYRERGFGEMTLLMGWDGSLKLYNTLPNGSYTYEKELVSRLRKEGFEVSTCTHSPYEGEQQIPFILG